MKIYKAIFVLFVANTLYSQSLSSLSGYYNIPSADIVEDATITAGAFYIPNRFSKEKGFDKDAIAYYGSVGFLPFVEMSLRFTKRLGPEYALGDRMLSFKIKVFNEGKIFPSLAIGAQDFFHSTENITNRYNSFYAVVTKNIMLGEVFNSVSLTGGYGSDIIKANGHEYIGFFGGISIKMLDLFELMFENDARFYNIGSRIKLLQHVYLLGGYRDLKYFSGGCGLYFNI